MAYNPLTNLYLLQRSVWSGCAGLFIGLHDVADGDSLEPFVKSLFTGHCRPVSVPSMENREP